MYQMIILILRLNLRQQNTIYLIRTALVLSRTLDLSAYKSKPERFVRGEPKLKELGAEVWINAPSKSVGTEPPAALMAEFEASA